MPTVYWVSQTKCTDDKIRCRNQVFEMDLEDGGDLHGSGQRDAPRAGSGSGSGPVSAAEWERNCPILAYRKPQMYYVCLTLSQPSSMSSAGLRTGLAIDRRGAVYFTGRYRNQFIVIQTQL